VAVEGRSTKAKARAALLTLAEKVAQTGRVIAVHTPGLDETFELSAKPTDQELLMRARTFATKAATVKDQFIAHLLPKTFVADVDAAIAAFEAAIQQRQAEKARRIAARTQIEQILTAGIESARALDAMTTNRLGDNPITM